MATLTNTELDAVNDILNSIGQVAVDTLSKTNPDVSLALSTLRRVSREVQSEGWSFNFEYDVELPVNNTTKQVAVGDTYLFVDGTKDHPEFDLIVRNGKLYDLVGQTDKFETDKVKVNRVLLQDLNQLPHYVIDYITARAAAMASTRMVGDPTQYQFLREREEAARARLIENDCKVGDYSYFGHQHGRQNYYTSYQPFQALSR
tara:strand:+ start:3477 stop:4085 length:609 start_codon:yes stop_codon:yes gene_type:complete